MTTAMYDFMAPITGKCVPIDALHSDLLGDKVLGEGVSILPTENTVVAPCDGLISRVSESNRTVTFLDTEHNLEILMEANTDSEHASFDLHVHAGEAVKAGTAMYAAESCGERRLFYEPIRRDHHRRRSRRYLLRL